MTKKNSDVYIKLKCSFTFRHTLNLFVLRYKKTQTETERQQKEETEYHRYIEYKPGDQDIYPDVIVIPDLTPICI